MEYEEYIKYFINNNRFFETTVKDFMYLASVTTDNYINKDNIERLVPILSEISYYSVIYGNYDINGFIDRYKIEDKERFYKISEVSEMCYKFLAMLVDSDCKHPVIQMYDSLKNASVEYEIVFDTLDKMATTARNDEMDEFAHNYDSVINDDIFIEEDEGLKYVANVYKNMDDKFLINILSQIIYQENYKKVCQLDSVKLGSYSYSTIGNINKTNPLISEVDGKKPMYINDIMTACIVSSKPLYMTDMMASLEILKEKFGDIILDDRYIDEDEYDDDLSDDTKTPDDIDFEYFDHNYRVNNGQLDMYDKKGKIDNNEEELVTIGAFVNFINNSYKLYKKHQYDFMKSSEATAKILTKCQDM